MATLSTAGLRCADSSRGHPRRANPTSGAERQCDCRTRRAIDSGRVLGPPDRYQRAPPDSRLEGIHRLLQPRSPPSEPGSYQPGSINPRHVVGLHSRPVLGGTTPTGAPLELDGLLPPYALVSGSQIHRSSGAGGQQLEDEHTHRWSRTRPIRKAFAGSDSLNCRWIEDEGRWLLEMRRPTLSRGGKRVAVGRPTPANGCLGQHLRLGPARASSASRLMPEDAVETEPPSQKPQPHK